MKETLYCVGCGRAVCEAEEGQVLAISCICGAGAPILQGTRLSSFWRPASLGSIIRQPARLPHLEYYLGYSDHVSEMKSEMVAQLREAGSTSQEECTKEGEGCQEAYKRGRERCQQELARREKLDLQDRERAYRELEIGER